MRMRLVFPLTAALLTSTSAPGWAQFAALPPLPHTVGMSGPDVEVIEAGIAAYDRHDLRQARADFRRALSIRSQTAIANFNLGVTETQLGDRRAGSRAMQRGYSLANEHGMGRSPQAGAMRTIARTLGVDLRD